MGIQKGSSPKAPCNNVAGAGFENSAFATGDWEETKIEGYEGRVACFYGSQLTASAKTVSAHIKVKETPKTVVLTSPPPVLVSIVRDGGTPDRDGAGVILRDQNGDIVWITPPADVLEVRSSLSLAGGLRTYTYEVENIGPEARDFDLPQVTTLAWPNGWSGTVLPGAVEATSVVATADDAHIHTCQAEFSIAEAGGTYALPAQVYVPESRLAFNGLVSINSIVYDPAQGNVVTFTLSGDGADNAVLVRDDGARLHIEAAVDGTYTPGVAYTLVDPDPPQGTNAYRVISGKEPNGVFSAEVTILN